MPQNPGFPPSCCRLFEDRPLDSASLCSGPKSAFNSVQVQSLATATSYNAITVPNGEKPETLRG